MPYCPPLTYCTNIHPAESWEETRRAIETFVPEIKKRAGLEGAWFPIGLRLSAMAVAELTGNERLRREFAEWMEVRQLEVYAINGFPYGAFHGTRVKENVFLPDWSSPERLEYTKQLFLILDEWARPGRDISVSTLPGSHKRFERTTSSLLGPVREMGRFLSRLKAESGRDCHLGFEPEPYGHFENSRETLSFLQEVFRGQEDEEHLRNHLGVTYDTCHLALQYEDATSTLARFLEEGIRISRIQASNAISLDPENNEALDVLKQFDEPVYFHQVVVKEAGDSRKRVFPDLPDALAWAEKTSNPGMEWRCHFHVPLGSKPSPPLSDTAGHLSEVIRFQKDNPLWRPHWEVETYTWSVLPPHLRTDLVDQVADEIMWLGRQFD